MNETYMSDKSKSLYNLIRNFGKTGIDHHEFIKLVREIERLRIENNDLIGNCEKSKRELRLCRKDNYILKTDLEDTRAMLLMRIEENNALKLDLNAYETREIKLKEALSNVGCDNCNEKFREVTAVKGFSRTHSMRVHQKYPQLANETQDDDSEVDYDDTGDSLDDSDNNRQPIVNHQHVHHKQRRSRSAHDMRVTAINSTSNKRCLDFDQSNRPYEQGTPAKKYRVSNKDDEMGEGSSNTSTLIPNGVNIDSNHSKLRGYVKKRRSVSCEVSREIRAEPCSTTTKSITDLRLYKKPEAPRWTTGSFQHIESRKHTLIETVNFLSMAKCDVCDASFIRSKSLNCSDCHQAVHKHCSKHLIIPCVPRQKVGGKCIGKNNRREYRLQDFCTNARPMIPFPIIHCVVAMERNEKFIREGIYRVPGNSITVNRLTGELRTQKKIPNLSTVHIEILTGTVKKFLMDLKDPLVPKTSRAEFIEAANKMSTHEEYGRRLLNTAICELPQANRDTMAYLFLHWKKIIRRSEVTKMPIENMARVLAKPVMGLPLMAVDEKSSEIDNANCEKTMISLFKFEDEYWEKFIMNK